MKSLNNERGFMLLNVVFLTLITALAAMILINSAPRIRNPQSVLRLTAIYLANEQFAMLESLAANGDSLEGQDSFLGEPTDLKSKNFSANKLVEFEVDTKIEANGDLREVKVKVSWKFDGKDFELETERTIRVVKKET